MENSSVQELLHGERGVWSVEFFPPKDEAGGEQIIETAHAIRQWFKPDFVSITYGAGGGTRERTFRYAHILKDELGFTVMPHLTCVGSSRQEIGEILQQYRDEGFRNIMALRGDPPKGSKDFKPHPDGFAYASELVAFIREQHPEFGIGAACYPEVHPEAESAEADIRFLRAKVDQGAHFLTTQLFYSDDVFLSFVEKCRSAGITVPIIPGLMPIRSAKQARRFCKVLPEALNRMLDAAGEDDAKLREVGIEWSCRQIRNLWSHGFRGFHFYIMNRSGMILEIMQRLSASGLGPLAK
ncbi:MAG: methylenetetrahydrofolate reductase [NAD(P)H] [Verrucomicrobia bacterium]|nr:methylenetetrahydrofolate reductase [NAD(P)H] [Verrucomicrobiota bacterium]